MYFTVYKTTNLVNGKIYVGVHQTIDPNDGYLGSGKRLHYAITKYGIHNFSKEILAIFDNLDDMFAMEAEIVNEDFVERNDTYNLSTGGKQALDYVNEAGANIYDGHAENWKTIQPMGMRVLLHKLATDAEFRKNHSVKTSKGMRQYYRNGGKNGFTNKKHKDSSKRKIGRKNSVHQTGEKNSQYGTKWIFSIEEKRSIKVTTDKVSEYLAIGWKLGRRFKF